MVVHPSQECVELETLCFLQELCPKVRKGSVVLPVSEPRRPLKAETRSTLTTPGCSESNMDCGCDALA